MPKKTKPQTASVDGKQRKKDPAAVSLGRRGGLIGGKVRMAKLTPQERSELGRKAIMARWSKRDIDAT